jgi:hypothetical protein
LPVGCDAIVANASVLPLLPSNGTQAQRKHMCPRAVIRRDQAA